MYESFANAAEKIRVLCTLPVRLGWRISDGILLKEYVRRLARLEEDASVRVSSIFFNPEDLPRIDVAQLSSCREALRPLTVDLENAYVVKLLQNYVLWNVMGESGHWMVALQPDLFAPILKMVARGAVFMMHHGEAAFDGFSVPLLKWRELGQRQPFEIGDVALSVWDR